jgi:uncharacterized protein
MKFLLENKATWLLFALLLQASIGLGQSIPKPMSPPRLVNDYAEVLTNAQRESLEDKLRKYNDSTTTELTIVTLKTIGQNDVTAFAFKIGEEWGVGKSGKDNGVVILVAVDDRKAAIVTGYGMEASITDANTYTIRQRYMNPNFREGKYYEGLDEATTAIFKLASGEWSSDQLKGNEKPIEPLAIIVPFLLMLAIFVLVMISGIYKFKKSHFGGHKNVDWLTLLILMNQANQRNARNTKHGGWGGFSGGKGSFGGGSSFGGFGGGRFGGGGSGGSW